MSQNVTKLQPKQVEHPSKANQFRRMLRSPDLEFIMEAHNGLSAKNCRGDRFQGNLGVRPDDLVGIGRAG